MSSHITPLSVWDRYSCDSDHFMLFLALYCLENSLIKMMSVLFCFKQTCFTWARRIWLALNYSRQIISFHVSRIQKTILIHLCLESIKICYTGSWLWVSPMFLKLYKTNCSVKLDLRVLIWLPYILFNYVSSKKAFQMWRCACWLILNTNVN